MSHRLLYIYVALLGLGALSQSGHAAGFSSASDPASLLGPKSLGRGGATVASDTDHDGIYQNLASAAFYPKYVVTGAYLGAGDALAASIVDTKSGPIGGALSYLYRDLHTNLGKNPMLGTYPRTEQRISAGAFGKIADQLAISLLVKYTYRSTYDATYPNKHSFNFDLGAKYLVSPRLTVGVVGQNILNDDNGLDVRAFTGGGEFMVMENWVVSGQLTHVSVPSNASSLTLPNPDKLTGWAVGTQYKNSGIAVRAGFSDHAAWETKLVAFGLGYEAKSFSIDYSFETATSSGPKLNIHTISLAAFL